MVALHLVQEPTDADVQRLALSVEAQRLDNLRLEHLLSELERLRQHPTTTGASVTTANGRAQARENSCRDTTPSLSPQKIQHARLVVPARALIGEPRRASSAYSYSLDSTFHRWRSRLVRQGVMAPLAGWRSYWAHWGIHTLGRAFCGLRGQCRLRALGRDARCFRALRLWERYVVMCRLWRAWRLVRDAMHLRRASLSARTLQGWRTHCNEQKRIRALVLQVLYRWRQRTVATALLLWRSFVNTINQRRVYVEQIALSCIVRLQSRLTARCLESWIEWVSDQRVKLHRQWVGWRYWQRQRRRIALHHRLQEFSRRVLRRRFCSALYHWRQHVHKSIAARQMQALVRAFVARQALERMRIAAIRLQQNWRLWLLRRQKQLLASAVARLRLREMSSAWNAWRHSVHQTQQLRNLLAKAIAHWQQSKIAGVLGQWIAAHKYRQDKERQLRIIRLRQVFYQWLSVYHDQLVRTVWQHWRHTCQLARLARSQLEMAAALLIQSFVRRSIRSRNAARERRAATLLQSLARALLDQRCVHSIARLESPTVNSSNDARCPTTTQKDNDDQINASTANQYRQLADARALEAKGRAARAVSQVQEHQDADSPGLANTSGLSDAGADADAIMSLKKKYTELRHILNKMEVGAQLHMHTPNGRVHATVWVELDLQQLRWERRGQQAHQRGHTHAEHSHNFDHITRVCWGAGVSPFQGVHVYNPEMCFSCECDDGSWLNFEATDASQLRDWVLGLQALVSKPGVPLVDASKLEWLLQQTLAAPIDDKPRNVLQEASAVQGSETVPNVQFDINQYLSECFDSVLDRNGNGCASVPALVDEMVVLLNTPDTARQGIGKQDLRALERIRNALVHEVLAEDHMWISFTQLVKLLTSDSDVDWARLYSNPHDTTLATRHRSAACDDFDAVVLAGVGLRMGSTCVICWHPLAPECFLPGIGFESNLSFLSLFDHAESRSRCLCSSVRL